jgi:heavy metal sensor kinase
MRLHPNSIWRSGRRTLGSIRGRLTLWYVAVLAFTLLGYCAILLVSLSRGLESGVDRVLTDTARQANMLFQAVSSDQELREAFRRINVGQIVALYDQNGDQLLAGRSFMRVQDHPLPVAGPGPRLDTVALPDGTAWRILTQRIAQPGQPDRLLVVARSETFVQVAVGELVVLIGFTAPLVLLLAIFGGMFLASRVLNPIDQITRTAEAISAEDLSRRLGVKPASDEVGRLAATFDHMLDRLEQAFQRQRQFTSDASHELRTPLSMLVSRAGLALERQRNAAEYEDVLRAVRDEGLHMGRIVNDLLMLARADAGDVLALSERLDLGELAGSVAEAMGLIAAKREIALSAASEDGVEVVGDQTRLTQLLVNLVDNALAHTPAGGRVELCASRDASHAILQVTDTGTGIAAEDLPHVFQRFFRAHGDRSRDRGGAGLGLALCQSIAQAHGGEISLDSEPGRGTRVTVRIPLSDRSTVNGHAAVGEPRGDVPIRPPVHAT